MDEVLVVTVIFYFIKVFGLGFLQFDDWHFLQAFLSLIPADACEIGVFL